MNQILPVHIKYSDLLLVTGSILKRDNLRLPLLTRDLYNSGEMVGGDGDQLVLRSSVDKGGEVGPGEEQEAVGQLSCLTYPLTIR